MVNGVKFNEIIYAIDSIIGRSTHSELRKINVRAAIRTSLSEKDMELKENNDYLLVRKLMSINESHANQIKIIKSVLIEADELEEKYTGGDEEGFK